jgi:hypothetical protein
MKKVLIAMMVMSVLVLSMVAGCTSDPIKGDCVSYLKNANPIVDKYSGAISKKIEDVNNKPNGEAIIAGMKNEVLPLMKEYREKMEAIKPATKDVQDIHNTYIAAIRTCEEGINGLAEAIAKKDSNLAKASADKISAISPAEDKWKNDFNTLAKNHGVKIE